MKRVYQLLNILRWGFLGAFIGDSLYRLHDYRAHPGLYAAQSAPWYLHIAIQAGLTAILVLVFTGIMGGVKRKIKRADRRS